MELTFAEAKAVIDAQGNVKIAIPEGSSEELTVGDMVEGKLIRLDYSGSYGALGDVFNNYTAQVDVPAVGGGVYHITGLRIFGIDTEQTTLEQIDLEIRINKLSAEIEQLNIQMSESKKVIIK